MSQLVAWRQAMWRSAESDHQIWSADADEGRNRVRLGIGSPDVIPDVESLAAEIGVPVEALYFEEMKALPVLAADVTDELRPTLGGIQASRTFQSSAECTLGFNVRDSGGDRYFLTASHCGDQYTSGTLGIDFYQPGDGDPFAPRAGETSHNPVWSTSGCNVLADYCRDTDAAAVEYDSGIGHAFSVAERSSIGSGSSAGNLTIGTSRRVIGTVAPAQGMVVYKTGRSTGTTTMSPGSLASGTCSSELVGGFGGDTLEIKCAHSASMRADRGTSFNPIAPLSVNIGGPTEVRDDQSCAWNSAVFGGRPPYTYDWSGVLSGSNPGIFGTVTSSGSLRLEIESDDGQDADDSISISVSPSAPPCVEFAPVQRGSSETSKGVSP